MSFLTRLFRRKQPALTLKPDPPRPPTLTLEVCAELSPSLQSALVELACVARESGVVFAVIDQDAGMETRRWFECEFRRLQGLRRSPSQKAFRSR